MKYYLSNISNFRQIQIIKGTSLKKEYQYFALTSNGDEESMYKWTKSGYKLKEFLSLPYVTNVLITEKHARKIAKLYGHTL